MLYKYWEGYFTAWALLFFVLFWWFLHVHHCFHGTTAHSAWMPTEKPYKKLLFKQNIILLSNLKQNEFVVQIHKAASSMIFNYQ